MLNGKILEKLKRVIFSYRIMEIRFLLEVLKYMSLNSVNLIPLPKVSLSRKGSGDEVQPSII